MNTFLIKLQPNPLMQLPLNVNGFLVNAILDTGSQLNIISRSALEKLHVETESLSNEFVLQLADGSTQKTTKGARLSIGMGSENFETMFAVVNSFPNDLLLGLEFMQEHDVVIKTRDRKVWIEGFQFDLPESAQTLGTNPSACYIETTTEIPARSELLIQLKRLELEDDLVLCEGSETALSRGLLVAPTLCRSTKNHVWVVVANPTRASISLIPGTVMAQAETVQESETGTSSSAFSISVNTEIGTKPQSKRLLNITDIDIGTNLTADQKSKLLGLIHSYDDIMSKHESDTGLTDVMEHSINTGDAAPINQRPYRLSFSERSQVQKLVSEYMDAGFITESDSPWACPIVIVKKKDGTLRFCCDWRKLNSVTRKDAMPLPRIDDMIDRFGEAKFISKLDFTSGYYQVPLDSESREKTAFVTPDGHYEWQVMGMGLTNAPATFQKLMYKVLGGLLWTNAMAYLDDIVVFSKSFDQHLVDLKAVFDRIRNCKLKIKIPKCSFAKAGIHYLGYVITPRGVECDPATTARVENFGIPKCRKDVRSFLGLTNYYRKFIKNYSNIAKPLHNLTRKDFDFAWTSECQSAFETLKSALTSPPILAFPNFDKPFILATDASGVGIGAVLKQKTDDGKEQVVAYASRVLNEAEQKYFPIERECLALKWACQVFRPYLFGTTFEVHTDHKPLTELKKSTANNEKLQRFRNALLGFDYEIKYKPGKKNGDADTMSRYGIPTETADSDDNDEGVPKETNDSLASKQSSNQKDGVSIPKTRPENIITWEKKTKPFRYPMDRSRSFETEKNTAASAPCMTATLSKQKTGILKKRSSDTPKSERVEEMIGKRLESARRNSLKSETPKSKLRSVVGFVRPLTIIPDSDSSESYSESVTSSISSETYTVETESSDDLFKPAKRTKRVQDNSTKAHVPTKRAKSEKGMSTNWGASERTVSVIRFSAGSGTDKTNTRRVHFSPDIAPADGSSEKPVGLKVSTYNEHAIVKSPQTPATFRK